MKVQEKKKKAKIILKQLNKLYPKTPSPLTHTNNFTLLISVLLSAQCTDLNVNNVTEDIYPRYYKPEHFVKLGKKKIEKLIKRIGLFRMKSKSVYNLSKILVKKYNGTVPKTFDELEALPGVGRKTANVVLNTAFGQPTIAVDTHIYRVANRTAIASGKTVLEVEKKLIKFIPDEFKVPAHHLMILHGRYVCKARSPHCPDCTLLDLCEYEEKNI